MTLANCRRDRVKFIGSLLWFVMTDRCKYRSSVYLPALSKQRECRLDSGHPFGKAQIWVGRLLPQACICQWPSDPLALRH